MEFFCANPQVGDTRIRRKFLILPVCVDGRMAFLGNYWVLEEFVTGGLTEPCFWDVRLFSKTREGLDGMIVQKDREAMAARLRRSGISMRNI